jgi:hypothetical protein
MIQENKLRSYNYKVLTEVQIIAEVVLNMFFEVMNRVAQMPDFDRR